MIPAEAMAELEAAVSVPTIGIGAGGAATGQVLVWQDMLGLSSGRLPRFVKQYADLRRVITEAVQQYRADISSGAFPAPEHALLKSVFGGIVVLFVLPVSVVRALFPLLVVPLDPVQGSGRFAVGRVGAQQVLPAGLRALFDLAGVDVVPVLSHSPSLRPVPDTVARQLEWHPWLLQLQLPLWEP